MAFELKMPQLSDTMYSGKILGWKKREGEKVSRGDILAEVETDKANLEIECFHEGTLVKILVPENQTANVGEVIAYIGAQGESVANTATPKASDAPSTSPVTASATATVPANQPVSVKVEPFHDSASNGGRLKASPLARKLAEQYKLSLSSVRGTGPDGRIIRKDVEQALNRSSTSSNVLSRPSAGSVSQTDQLKPATLPTQPGEGTLEPFSKMRATIARRMQESVTQAPHFFTTTSVNMREALKLRELLKKKPEYKGISINHLVVKASAYALNEEPRVNRAIRNDQVYTPAAVNIGIVVAVEDGLLIPVVRDANRLALKDIVFEARAAVERARSGRPNATDLTGGTFSISNMGMYDVENFTAIINPGQGAILAVSSIKDQPIVEAGQILVAPLMKVTLSVDHRVIDGVMAGNFLEQLKTALEAPALLAL